MVMCYRHSWNDHAGTSETNLDRTLRGINNHPGHGLLGEWGLQETM